MTGSALNVISMKQLWPDGKVSMLNIQRLVVQVLNCGGNDTKPD
jgi:hypothetical protein